MINAFLIHIPKKRNFEKISKRVSSGSRQSGLEFDMPALYEGSDVAIAMKIYFERIICQRCQVCKGFWQTKHDLMVWV